MEDVIRIVRSDVDGGWTNAVVAIRRRELHEFAVLGNLGIVTHFDFNRYLSGHDWGDAERFEKTAGGLVSYEGGVQAGRGSYVIGRHITIPDADRSDIARSFVERAGGRAGTYTAFKVRELSTNRLLEASCDPRKLSNYFQRESDLPHELSPAFFDPEVLAKYKADTEKYELTDHGGIRCRGVWGLRSYHVNAAGQVHAYLVDLNKLPEHEQRYWLSFNEWPKGGLAERAIYNDFRGEFHPEYDPLHSLKRKVEELDAAPPSWWKPRGEELRRVVHPPVTDSVDEWANAILYLDQLVVEGLLQRSLRKLLGELDRQVDSKWRALKLAEEWLGATGRTDAQARLEVAPLREVHDLRSKVRGHAAPRERLANARRARKEHGSLAAHFEALVAGCDRALAALVAATPGTDVPGTT